MSSGFDRQDGDRVTIPVVGRKVSRCIVDAAFGIQFLEEMAGYQATLRIESSFTWKDDFGEWTLSTDDLGCLGNALRMLHQTVVEANAMEGNGSLELRFLNGAKLCVVPEDARFEAWQYKDSSGVSIVSLPGGGLSIWHGKTS